MCIWEGAWTPAEGDGRKQPQLTAVSAEPPPPPLLRQVLVVAGRHRGARGTLREIDTARFQARVELRDSSSVWLEYEQLSRWAPVAAG